MPAKPIASRHSALTNQQTRSATVIAFDYGRRRIGVAVGDAAVGIAHPLLVIESRAGEQPWEQIDELVAEWKPSTFVVGMPVHDEGRDHELAGAVRRFTGRLAQRFGLPVQMVDERFTSYEAASQLREAGVRGRAQRPHLDASAATVILQAFFESANARA